MTPPRTATRRVRVRRHSPGEVVGGRATLAVEEPLQIRIDGVTVATTMRTPGNDFDLALGFAITDAGVDPARIGGMAYCGDDAGEVIASGAAADLTGPYAGGFGTINVATRDGAGSAIRRQRSTAISSACGICGADVVTDLLARTDVVVDGGLRLEPATVTAIPRTARAAQRGFEATGATHAASAHTADGGLVVLREDVGRHNAVDKVIGALASDGALPATGMVLFTSGRVAVEIVAKALVGGFAAVVAVSAPTSLAVDAATAAGLTLVGFTRDDSFTAYSREDRITTT